MKLVPSNETVKRALSGHAAIGLLAGALLYLVCLSGAVVVFYPEWQRIEQANAPEMATIAPEAVQRAMGAVLASERGKPATTHLYVHLPVPDLPRTTVTTDTQAVHVHADGTIAMPEENSWSEFLLALHYTLHLPSLVGITIVGLLGAAMVALAVTGAIAHPRIFRDAFRMRARHAGGVGLADWHNRLSVWTLPFGLTIAITGAAIGLATVTAYAIGARYYGGKVEAVYAPIFGKEAAADPAPAPIANVAQALRHLKASRPEVTPSYVILHDPATAGQHVQLIGLHARRLIFGEYYEYDAAGRFHKSVGLADGTLGQQAAASNYNLHFGNFGGLPVKIAYCLFGLALTVVSATGTYIWLGKRERRGLHAPRLRGAWDGIVWGAPAALALTLVARFAIGNDAPFVAIFWVALAAGVITGIVRKHRIEVRAAPALA